MTVEIDAPGQKIPKLTEIEMSTCSPIVQCLETFLWSFENFEKIQTQYEAVEQKTMHNGGAHGHFDFLTQCINFYSHSLIFPAILPPLIIYNLFIWWNRWVSGEEYYHFLYFAFSVAQTVPKLQVFCFFWSVNDFRESHNTLQQQIETCRCL